MICSASWARIWTNPFWSMMEIPPTKDVVRVVVLDCSNCLTWQVNIVILVRKKQMICHRISLIVAYCRLCLFIAYPRAARVSMTCRVPQTRRRTRKAFQMIIVCWPMRREGCAGTKGRSFSVVSKIPLWFSPIRRHSLRLLVSLASIRTLLEDVADGFVE